MYNFRDFGFRGGGIVVIGWLVDCECGAWMNSLKRGGVTNMIPVATMSWLTFLWFHNGKLKMIEMMARMATVWNLWLSTALKMLHFELYTRARWRWTLAAFTVQLHSQWKNGGRGGPPSIHRLAWLHHTNRKPLFLVLCAVSCMVPCTSISQCMGIFGCSEFSILGITRGSSVSDESTCWKQW